MSAETRRALDQARRDFNEHNRTCIRCNHPGLVSDLPITQQSCDIGAVAARLNAARLADQRSHTEWRASGAASSEG